MSLTTIFLAQRIALAVLILAVLILAASESPSHGALSLLAAYASVRVALEIDK